MACAQVLALGREVVSESAVLPPSEGSIDDLLVELVWQATIDAHSVPVVASKVEMGLAACELQQSDSGSASTLSRCIGRPCAAVLLHACPRSQSRSHCSASVGRKRTRKHLSLSPISLQPSPMEQQQNLVAIRAELKAWEKSFKARQGREPSKTDIKANPDIGQSLLISQEMGSRGRLLRLLRLKLVDSREHSSQVPGVQQVQVRQSWKYIATCSCSCSCSFCRIHSPVQAQSPARHAHKARVARSLRTGTSTPRRDIQDAHEQAQERQ